MVEYTMMEQKGWVAPEPSSCGPPEVVWQRKDIPPPSAWATKKRRKKKGKKKGKKKRESNFPPLPRPQWPPTRLLCPLLLSNTLYEKKSVLSGGMNGRHSRSINPVSYVHRSCWRLIGISCGHTSHRAETLNGSKPACRGCSVED